MCILPSPFILLLGSNFIIVKVSKKYKPVTTDAYSAMQ